MAGNEGIKIGVVDRYFNRPQVALVKLTEGGVRMGDTLRFVGANTDFEMLVEHMELDRRYVESARQGDLVGITTTERTRPGDEVLKITR
ncbi:MAG: translation elongation factor-like protein [Syntrophales bacterium LBB04]|nr:translation elongation factor-like protein [Syntrophales bacterium LBB04]